MSTIQNNSKILDLDNTVIDPDAAIVHGLKIESFSVEIGNSSGEIAHSYSKIKIRGKPYFGDVVTHAVVYFVNKIKSPSYNDLTNTINMYLFTQQFQSFMQTLNELEGDALIIYSVHSDGTKQLAKFYSYKKIKN
ncbi:MAG: hypothetical protein HRU38_11135 [Saccharospirillaceae bacterium]|nr:hypothetical protein [Pseudomonadales bacterium]NRB79207.1 hypothetical protein [Saccharospirillaceae bacterium]